MRGFGTSVRRDGRSRMTGRQERRFFRWGAVLTLFMGLLPLLAACGFQADEARGLAADQTLTWPY
jgi:hypothetical protein